MIQVESMSSRDAAMFPLIASVALLGLYAFFKGDERIFIKMLSFLTRIHPYRFELRL